jgi:hypothetical protein
MLRSGINTPAKLVEGSKSARSSSSELADLVEETQSNNTLRTLTKSSKP